MRDIKIKVMISNEEFEFSSAEELLIDKTNLDQELSMQASTYAWFNVLYERARYQRVRSESELEELEALIDKELRNSGKKFTESEIKSAVRRDENVICKTKQLEEFEYYERLLSVLTNALSQRKDMLISLSRSRYLELTSPSSAEVEKIKKYQLRKG